jgi:glycosyltransferase involved in cell wall biosynthesis
MISVIIPCHNASSTLRMAVDSVFAQSYPAKEIIIIDDGSTDASVKIIESYGAAVVAKFQPNQGASAARNHGTRLARGNYIQYLDADDMLAPDTLAKRVAALETTGADVAYTDWEQFNVSSSGLISKGNVIAVPFEQLAEDAEAACASTFWAPPAAILYRKWVVDRIGEWNARLPIIQDARFIFDAARVQARFTHVGGVGALYRVSKDSLSRRLPAQFIRDCFVNASEIEAIWRKDGNLTAAKRKALIQMWSFVATSTFRADLPEFGEACQRLRKVSNRPHLELWLRKILSEIVGKSAVWSAEKQLRRVLRSLRWAVRASGR